MPSEKSMMRMPSNAVMGADYTEVVGWRNRRTSADVDTKSPYGRKLRTIITSKRLAETRDQYDQRIRGVRQMGAPHTARTCLG